MEISRSRHRLKILYLIFFLASCQFFKEVSEKDYTDFSRLIEIDDILNIKIYDIYVRTCETLISKNNLNSINEKTCLLALKNKNLNFNEVRRFFNDNFSYDSETQNNNIGIMTGYYEPEIKAYRYEKEDSYPIYTMNTEKYGEDILKLVEMKLIMEY